VEYRVHIGERNKVSILTENKSSAAYITERNNMDEFLIDFAREKI
jgi:hypothetical protein